MQIRKPNRVSRPVRVTQRGSSTSYPHANRRKMALLRNRYADVVVRRIHDKSV
jgi:hypothetical protein